MRFFFFFFLVRLFDLCILLKQSQSSILAAFTNLRSGIIINPEFTYYTAFVALFLLQCDTLISCDFFLSNFAFVETEKFNKDAQADTNILHSHTYILYLC